MVYTCALCEHCQSMYVRAHSIHTYVLISVSQLSEVASRGPHGLESDVWSLGCMLYTLFTGRPPFDVSNYTHYNLHM